MRLFLKAPLILALLSTSALASETISYSYDALGRLVVTARSGSINDGVQHSTSYDPAGNRTTYVVNGVVAGALSISSASTVEGGGLSFTVNRPSPSNVPVTVDYRTTDGTAVAGTRYTATSGSLVFQPGDLSKTITVSTIDDAVIQGSQTMNVVLSNPTGGATLAVATGTGAIDDNDAVQFAVGNAPTVTEGSALVYSVTRSGSTIRTNSVNYATANGSGVAGTDYNAASGTLTFGPSETSKTIAIGTIDDNVPQTPRTVLINLSAPTGGATLATGQGSGTINDNDVTPISFAISGAPTITEGGTLVFNVTKTGSTYLSTSVNFSTADGSAVAGSDYYATSGVVTFAPGDTTKAISVGTINDNLAEPTETLQVNLSGANGGSIGAGSATGTITDDDRVTFSVAQPSPALEGSGTFQFVVTKSGSTNYSESVNYSTADGSAIAGSDYTAASGTLTFAPSETSKTVNVQPIDNTVAQPSRTLYFNLSGASGPGAVITTGQATGIINDNDTTPVTLAIANAPANNAPSVTEGGVLVFTVTKQGNTYLPISVNYSTHDGTAVAGSDYAATSGVLTFSPSEATKTIAVQTIDDALQESTESLNLQISSPTNGATLVSGWDTAAGYITDNDLAPMVVTNPSLAFDQDTSNAITIATLATLNGRSARVVTFAPPSGGGSGTLSADGQSVTYVAPHVGTAAACEPAGKLNVSASYTVRDVNDGSTASGSVAITVKGSPGSKKGCQ